MLNSKLIPLLFLMLPAFGVISQSSGLPIENFKNDSSLFVFLQEEFDQLHSYHNKVKFSARSIEISQQQGFPKSEAYAHYLMGNAHWAHAKYPDALHHLQIALSGFKKLGLVSSRAQGFNTLGLTYFYTAQYNEAITYLDSALTLFHQEKDSSNIARVMNNLGLVHQKIGDYQRSTDYLVQGMRHKVNYAALVDQSNSSMQNSELHNNAYVVGQLIPEVITKMKAAKKVDDLEAYVESIADLGTLYQLIDEHDSAFYYLERSASIYDSLGQVSRYVMDVLDIADGYTELGDWEKGRSLYQELLPKMEAERLIAVLGNVLEKLAHIDFNQGQYQSAINWYDQAVKLNDSVGHRASVAKMKLGIAKSYLQLNDFALAKNYALESERIATAINSFDYKLQASSILATIYQATGDFQKAFTYQSQHMEMILLQKNAEAFRTTKELEAKYELQSKANDIRDLGLEVQQKNQYISQQTLFIIVLAIAVVLFLGLLVLVYRSNTEIRKLNVQIGKRNAENETLLKEVHHRVKNNLQMISGLINMQQRRSSEDGQIEILKETKNRVRSIGMLHEHLYSFQEYSKTAAKPYVEKLVGMLLASTKTNTPVEVRYRIEPFELKADDLLIIGLIINELVTNALKYAFAQSERPMLIIALTVHHEDLHLEVEDNGAGISELKEGFGWTIINAMVENLNGERKIYFENGTKVFIKMNELLNESVKDT